MDDLHRYDAIINLPHHVSQTHPPMSRLERAAQFSPFAALTGYEDAARETARLTDSQRELAEDEKLLLERRLQQIQAQLEAGRIPAVSVTWFRPDTKKQGGAYVTTEAAVKRIDELERAVVLTNGDKIAVEAIIGIEWTTRPEQEEA